MNRKPWPLVVIAALHFFEPQIKILFYSWLWNMPLGTILAALGDGNQPVRLFLFLFAFPIAGIAIFAVRRWSLPVFFFMQALVLSRQIYDAYHYPTQIPLVFLAVFIALNSLVTLYFLVPAVRLAYIDPRVRWWEAKPRYEVRWPTHLTQDTRAFDAVISNVSEGGFFCELEKAIPLDTTQEIQATFAFQDTNFEVLGAFRHSHFSDNKAFYGIQFQGLNLSMKRALHAVVRQLERSGVPRKPPRESSLKAFWKWLMRLLTTGKGLFPEIRTPRGP